MELDKLSKIEEAPLSGAYIRSLVKQLASSRTEDSIMNSKDQGCVVDGSDVSHVQSFAKHVKGCKAQQSTQPQQHKKQVRRRLHTSKPYQEKLLNMAEARREIVTALKFHRAAMKQASEKKQKQQQQQATQEKQQSFEQDGRFNSRRNPRIYPSCTTNFSNYMDDFSCSYLSQPPPPSDPNSYPWHVATPIAPPPSLMAENPNFVLPTQTLGLNLNFHDFNNFDATLNLNNSSPTSSSPPISVLTDQEFASSVGGVSQGEGSSSVVDTVQSSAAAQLNGGLHTAMDDEGMAEIRSLGEQYQMEWNDTMNLVKSACWFKYLKNMEHGGGPEANTTEDDAYHNFEELVEFPAWLNANGSCLEKCSEDYFQDSSSLPCMDIGDIEGMDEDWLA